MSLSPELEGLPPQFDYDAFELPENIHLSFRFAPHSSSLDLPPRAELEQELKTADGIILEGVQGGQNDLRKVFARISQGDSKIYQAYRTDPTVSTFGSWSQAFFDALYSTRVPITNIDTTTRTKAIQTFLASSELCTKIETTAVNDQALLDRLMPVMPAYFGSVQQRDQVILKNITPGLNELTAANRKLHAKRQTTPLTINVYYGTMHRSLFDAVVHKASIEPAVGFSTSAEIIDERSKVSSYAYFLRTGQVSESLTLYDAKIGYMTSVLVTYGYDQPLPLKDLQQQAEGLIEGKNFAEVKALGKELSRGKKARQWQL